MTTQNAEYVRCQACHEPTFDLIAEECRSCGATPLAPLRDFCGVILGQERYQGLVRAKDPATMEKRRAAAVAAWPSLPPDYRRQMWPLLSAEEQRRVTALIDGSSSQSEGGLADA